MSEEYIETVEVAHSPFWPLFVLLVGLLAWSGYQVYAINSQRFNDDQQFQALVPTINNATGVANKYVALMKDLIQTSQKDPAAQQIVKDAIQAGWIKVQNNTNSSAAPADATPSK